MLENTEKKPVKILLLLFVILIPTLIYYFWGDKKIEAKKISMQQQNILLPRKYLLPNLVENPPTKEIPPETINENKQLRVPILMYHYIDKAPSESKLPTLYTEPEIFENQVKSSLEMGYKTVFTSELGSYFKSGRALPDNPIIFTFDDGYEDFYFKAFPILKKYKAKGVLYVIVESVGKPGYITKDQAKEMVQSGFVEIGSHTLNHTNLSSVDKIKALNELLESKNKLSEIIDKEVVSFAYPFGKFTYRDELLAEKAGYLSSASTFPGIVQKKTQLHTLYRLRPGKRISADYINWLNKQ